MAKVIVDDVLYAPAQSVKMVDMPKLESPFVRVDGEGRSRIVTPEIAEGMEWVFEADDVIAVEKLDGTNVSAWLANGELLALNNRANVIKIGIMEGNRFIAGVRAARERNRLPGGEGQFFGELMGPKIQGNFLELDAPEWFPFEHLCKKFAYNSWGKYPKDFDTISNWLKNDIFSLAYVRYHGKKIPPEGVVFWQISTGKRAKLRLDMFDWYKGEFARKVER